MSPLHLLEFPNVRFSAQQAVTTVGKAPVCIHCANGYHEQILVEREYCSCACHANPAEQVKYEVAA